MILAYKLSRLSVNAATNLWQALYGGLENRRPAETVAELGLALSGRRLWGQIRQLVHLVDRIPA
jgi:hypothetical protein